MGDNLSMTFLFFFFAGSSDKAAPVLRPEGQKVGDELPFFCFSALNVIFYFQTSVQTSLTLSAFEFAIFDFEHSSFAILNVIICLCNEAALALFFCHKAVSTFYLY